MSERKNLLLTIGIVAGLFVLSAFFSLVSVQNDNSITGMVASVPGCKIQEICTIHSIEEYELEIDGEVTKEKYFVCVEKEVREVCN